jgi:sugar phosphate isomerase/epimerase
MEFGRNIKPKRIKMTSRRKFLKNTGVAVGSAAIISQLPAGILGCSPSKPKDFGFQVWTIREKLVADFPGTLKEMAAMGYTQVEMCSPLGYSNAGFEPLNHMSGTEMRAIIEEAGLQCVSSHYNMGELRNSLENRIEWATQLGMKQMVAASFGLPGDASVDDFRRAADELNKIGETTRAAGIQMVFHNHHGEFEKRGDELIYDALLDQFDAELVKMQFQVAVVNIGYKAADYFRNYPGRFISAHLADWSAEKEEQVSIGQGVIDWDDFFEAAKTGGVKNYLVEMAPETFAPSAAFLKELG